MTAKLHVKVSATESRGLSAIAELLVSHVTDCMTVIYHYDVYVIRMFMVYLDSS